MNYPVLCYSCPSPAEYKVAAEWSDGLTRELKTYALSCPACLGANFAKAKLKQSQCRLLHGETLEVPGIYTICRGNRDHQLLRKPELEV
ncbi:hypothetical protein [Limnoglobus roseus]|uniref:Uncharacterized protein n=1 Tax=Limnoglobus roseus TaxID=2598579 RepID=A0A5C1AJV0_9BACT|nr:hypothetical protein [Limnoglobus roseus]QEL17188.1 hypothetical protein PX52LOC_04171 [Limnoglobus roseus]